VVPAERNDIMTEVFVSAATLTVSAILMGREIRIVKRIETHRRIRGLL
jgi:hypothetical protein